MGIEFESGANRIPERRRKVCYIRIKLLRCIYLETFWGSIAKSLFDDTFT
jgi:hypothetical protein